MLKINKNKSFTLIEVVVAVAIFAMAAALTIAISANVINTRYKTESITNVQKNAQNIIQVLTNEVFQGNSCDSFYDPGPASTIDYFGFMADTKFSDYVRISSDPGYPLPYQFTSSKLNVVYIDQFNQKIKKEVYLDFGDENLKIRVTNLSTGQIYERNLNDDSVIIEKIASDQPLFTTPAILGLCAGGIETPTAQNYLKINVKISSRTPDPKGHYELKIYKYISAKNFEYRTR